MGMLAKKAINRLLSHILHITADHGGLWHVWNRQDIGIEQFTAHCIIGRFSIGLPIKCY